MRNLILSLSVFVLVACGGNSNAAPPSDPSSPPPATTTTTTTTTTTEAKPSSSTDGKCGVTKTSSATALDACMAECEPLSDKAPEGSRCLPPKTECKMNCDHKFKSAK